MKDKQLDLFIAEVVDVTDHTETKTCAYCREVLPATPEYFSSNVAYNGKIYLKNSCRACRSKTHSVVHYLRKTSPPPSKSCDCCGQSFKGMSTRDIHLDHCKETDTFRGWLCKNCNVGLGMLGDDIKGLELALAYLNKHKDRLDNG